MGTRDDEYDYLFKGMAGGAQMDEVSAADSGPKFRPGRLAQVGAQDLGSGGTGSREGRGRLVSTALGRRMRPCRLDRPKGPRFFGCALAGLEPRGGGALSGDTGRWGRGLGRGRDRPIF